MKKRGLLLVLTLCMILVVSCGTNQQKKTRKQLETERIAHSHNCMTFDEFCDLKYSYVYEKKLPCLVYIDEFHVSDIVSDVDESHFFTSESEEDENEEEIVKPSWIGTPSQRENECWMKGLIISNQYIGLDKTQVDWAITKTKNTKTIYTPMVIKVYQVSMTVWNSSRLMSFKADLVSVLNEE